MATVSTPLVCSGRFDLAHGAEAEAEEPEPADEVLVGVPHAANVTVALRAAATVRTADGRTGGIYTGSAGSRPGQDPLELEDTAQYRE